MKKAGFILILSALIIAGCTPTNSKKKRASSVEPSSEISSSAEASSVAPIASSSVATFTSQNQTSNTPSITPSSNISNSSTSTTPVVTLQKIAAIKSQRQIGSLVSFQATYLRALTLNNDRVLMFADETGYIGFRCTTQSDYINNNYRFQEYKVTGKLVEKENGLEVAYESTFGDLRASVERLGEGAELSYKESETTLPVQLTGISQIKEKSALLVQDSKLNAYGEIVRFTAQYANFESDNSKEKTFFIDANGEGIVVIQDNDTTGGHKLTPLMSEDNIGKWYELTGIISIKTSIPAILAWTCTYVPKSEVDEQNFDVTYATDVTSQIEQAFYNGNLTSDKLDALPNEMYFKLYHANGWLYDDGTCSGFTLIENGTIPDNGKNTRKGFYFVNGKDIWGENGTAVEIYFKIQSYDTQNHIWKIFVIEKLLFDE